MNSSLPYQTLHSHTLYSDGKMTHAQVMTKAVEYKTGVVAFTDHDCLMDDKALNFAREMQDGPVKWISGIEISSSLPPEVGGGQHSSLHILGLFVDPFDTALMEHCKQAKVARIERMEHIVGALQKLGFDITAKECLAASGGEVVGKPHIVEALKGKQINSDRLQALVVDMKEKVKDDSQKQAQYELMIAAGEHQYPYQMFLSSDAFIQGVLPEDIYQIDLDTTVKTIRNAGGIAIIAHYFSIKSKIPYAMLEQLLKENRLDGMETVHGMWQWGTERWSAIDEDQRVLKGLCERYDRLQTGGVDLHSEEDFKKFVELEWYAKETVGMAERIVESGLVDRSFSSLNNL